VALLTPCLLALLALLLAVLASLIAVASRPTEVDDDGIAGLLVIPQDVSRSSVIRCTIPGGGRERGEIIFCWKSASIDDSDAMVRCLTIC